MNIQELTDYTVDTAPMTMEVKTEKLFPVNSSTWRHVFRLDPSAGSFLDKNSMLMFKPLAKDGTVSAAGVRLNCWNGALSCLKRITLNIGDNQIEDIEGVGLWSAINALYMASPDVQNKRLSHYLGNCLKYKVSEDTANSQLTGGTSSNPGQILVDNVKSGIDYGNSAGGGAAAVRSHQITNDADANNRMAIPIGMILNSIRNQTLPLFLFKDHRINIVVEFESLSSGFANKMSNDSYAADPAGGQGQSLACADGDVRFTEVEMLVDYLVMPSSVQEQYRTATAAEGGYDFEFVNVSRVLKTIPSATANATQKQEHRLNFQDQELHYVQQIKQLPPIPYAAAVADTSALRGAFSDKVLLDQRSDSISVQSYQMNINGVDVFPQPYNNALTQYNQLSYNLGSDIQIPKVLSVNDTNNEYGMLTNSSMGIKGKFNVLAYDARNGNSGVKGAGTQVGAYPVNFIYYRKPHAVVSKGDFPQGAGGTGAVELGKDETGALDVNYFVGTTRIVNVRQLASGGNAVAVMGA